MTDEAEAAGILISTYKGLGLEEQMGEIVSSCTVKYTSVQKKDARSCSWGVKDSILNVEVYDTDIDSGVRRVISSFSRESMGSDPRLLVRLSFVPSLLFILLVLFIPVLSLGLLLIGHGLIGALIGAFGMIIAPMLLIWGNRVKQIADHIFMERLVRATSLDEKHVGELYSDFLTKTPWVWALVSAEFWLLFCALLALLFSGLF